MANALRIFYCGITLICLSSLASSTTWLYNAPRGLLTLAGSASASASVPDASHSHITDLRKKELKSAQLQEEKEVVGLEALPEATGPEESSDDETTGGNNEASPSLLQKKINKILAKLRLIAQIKNAYHYTPEDHDHETNITFPPQDDNVGKPQTMTEPAPKTDTTESIPADTKSRLENMQEIPSAVSNGVPNQVKPAENEPIRINLEVSQINDKLDNLNTSRSEKSKEAGPNRLGALGVFFAELVGSIVGLTYGAFAQLANNGGQSPVTVSTSEGL